MKGKKVTGKSETRKQYSPQFKEQALEMAEKITMDKSGSNKAAMDKVNQHREVPIEVR